MQVSLRLGKGRCDFTALPTCSLLDEVLSLAEVWLPTLHCTFQAAGASVKEMAPAFVFAS